MIRPLPIGLAVLCLGIFALGCSTARTLDGTWVQEGQVPQTMTVTGGEYKSSMTVMGQAITVTGKLTYDDKALTAKVAEIKLDAPGLAAPMLAQAQASVPKEIDFEVSWKNSDEVVMSPKGQPMMAGANGTFKRQK